MPEMHPPPPPPLDPPMPCGIVLHRATLFLISFCRLSYRTHVEKSRRPSMKINENLEIEEQLWLVESVLTLLILTICINFFTELKLTTWGN